MKISNFANFQFYKKTIVKNKVTKKQFYKIIAIIIIVVVKHQNLPQIPKIIIIKIIQILPNNSFTLMKIISIKK